MMIVFQNFDPGGLRKDQSTKNVVNLKDGASNRTNTYRGKRKVNNSKASYYYLDQMLINVRGVMVLMLEKGMPRKSDAVATAHFNDTKPEWTHNAPAPGPASSNTLKEADCVEASCCKLTKVELKPSVDEGCQKYTVGPTRKVDRYPNSRQPVCLSHSP
jgi:hypothetical protein